MSREKKYTAIILKKQPFGEVDELITVFTKEAGKLRLLAKGIKKPKSKLQHALQTLFLVNLRIAGRGTLSKIIGAEAENTFSYIRTNLECARLGVYAAEAVLKFSADEHPNQRVFLLLLDFLNFIDEIKNNMVLDEGLIKFKVSLLEATGWKIKADPKLASLQSVAFDRNKGGFVAPSGSANEIPVKQSVFNFFLMLSKVPFSGLPSLAKSESADELQQILSGFIEHHLEREIKSEKHLKL